MKFNVPSMTCGHCKAAIETAARAVDADAITTVDLAQHTVEIVSPLPAEAFQKAMHDAGYDAQPAP